MAKRLTEDDIRRIFREEATREKKEAKKLAGMDEDVRRTWERLETKTLPTKGIGVFFNPSASEIDWPQQVQQVIDTYWEVVEEGLNA